MVWRTFQEKLTSGLKLVLKGHTCSLTMEINIMIRLEHLDWAKKDSNFSAIGHPTKKKTSNDMNAQGKWY